MAKIVARAQDWTRKWEITGKSRPRRHIAWSHDIVCSRWLAQAASEIATYAKQVTVFNRMIVVWNDQTSCSEFGVLIGHLVRNCLLVAFWLCFCLWFCLLVFWVSDMWEHCAMLMGHREKCWAKLCPGSCPPDRPPARQEIRSIFGKISLIFDKNRPYFLTGNAGNQTATAGCLERASVRWAEAAFAPPAKV